MIPVSFVRSSVMDNVSRMLLFLLGFACSCLVVSADEIFTSAPGVSFGQSLLEPKYKIEFHPFDSPFHPESDQELVVMTKREGQSYVCFLPLEDEPEAIKSASQSNSSNLISDTETKIRWKTPDELLDLLKDECFYRHEGWWSYEFCYQKHVSQVHVEEEKFVQKFYLGFFDAEATASFNQHNSDMSLMKDPSSNDASQRYHVHKYTNGTICDLTGQPREAEVRFVCSESVVVINSIKELSTCKYAVTVQCPMLCKHPMFRQEKPVWHTVHCNEFPAEAAEESADDVVVESKTKTTLGDLLVPIEADDMNVQPS